MKISVHLHLQLNSNTILIHGQRRLVIGSLLPHERIFCLDGQNLLCTTPGNVTAFLHDAAVQAGVWRCD